MTRYDAKTTIYRVINSGILDSELEADLTELVNVICEDGFEECEVAGLFRYCEGCKHLRDPEMLEEETEGEPDDTNKGNQSKMP